MQEKMSLGQFRSEIGDCDRFRLIFGEPLSPLSISLVFDHAAVSLSSTPYIAMKNGDDYLCLSNIKSVRRRYVTQKANSYVIRCDDFTFSDDPEPMEFILSCAKSS